MPQEAASALEAATSRRLPTEIAVTKGRTFPPSPLPSEEVPQRRTALDGAKPPCRSRSVGQLGSHSDMTRRIAFLHQPGGRRSAAAPHKLDAPEGQTDTRP